MNRQLYQLRCPECHKRAFVLTNGRGEVGIVCDACGACTLIPQRPPTEKEMYNPGRQARTYVDTVPLMITHTKKSPT